MVVRVFVRLLVFGALISAGLATASGHTQATAHWKNCPPRVWPSRYNPAITKPDLGRDQYLRIFDVRTRGQPCLYARQEITGGFITIRCCGERRPYYARFGTSSYLCPSHGLQEPIRCYSGSAFKFDWIVRTGERPHGPPRLDLPPVPRGDQANRNRRRKRGACPSRSSCGQSAGSASRSRRPRPRSGSPQASGATHAP